MSVYVSLTAFFKITKHKSISFSPNSASSGILDTASDTIFDANGSRNDNIFLCITTLYISRKPSYRPSTDQYLFYRRI